MKEIEKKILVYVPTSKGVREVKRLLEEFKTEVIQEYIKQTFKGGIKKHEFTEDTKEIFKQYLAQEIKTSKAMELLKMSKTTFYRYLKEFQKLEG